MTSTLCCYGITDVNQTNFFEKVVKRKVATPDSDIEACWMVKSYKTKASHLNVLCSVTKRTFRYNRALAWPLTAQLPINLGRVHISDTF